MRLVAIYARRLLAENDLLGDCRAAPANKTVRRRLKNPRAWNIRRNLRKCPLCIRFNC